MNELYTIAFLLLPKVGRKTIQKLYLENLNINIDEYFFRAKLKALIDQHDKLRDVNYYLNKANIIMEKSRNANINIISVFNKNFPSNFKSIEDFPVIIHYKGNKDLLYKERNLAIIGTRAPTNHGIKATARLTEIAISQEYTIVSGLALGCDAQAHKTTLENKGYTIAVMPGGLESIYPKTNKPLGDEILDNDGCLISEYNIGTKPFPGHYIERDRLQAALSKGIIVIETKADGGSMHAIRQGLKTQRLVGAYINPDYYRGEALSNIEGNLNLINNKMAMPLNSKENVALFFRKLEEKTISNLMFSNIQLNILDKNMRRHI